METIRTCPQCQQPLSADAPDGLCPQCLMKAATGPLPTVVGVGLPGDIIDIGDPGEVAKKLPQFEILEILGRGGMGVVYKARQVQLDRLVALKILPPVDALSPDFVARFTREARALAKLNHPNIVNVHDFGETGGLYYIVMEYVEGANLRQLFEARKLSPAEALAIIPKICDALEYAHEEGLVHRDIKPENLLIDKKGRVKIADFGLAKLLRREPLDMTLTLSGMALGTLRYMAPEQMDKPESVDHRADLYSLGVVIYEMLTGETPVGRFELPSQKAQVDVRLDQIVLHALEREPARRYQHASEVRDDVEKVTSKPQVAPSAPPTPHEPLPPISPAQSNMGKPWSAWVWWIVLVLITLPFFQIAELNRAEQMAGHGPKYGPGGILPLVLLAFGGFAIIKLLELRQAKAGATLAEPFSQAWLGTIVAIFGVCVIAIGPFPHVEWLHETLKVIPSRVPNSAGALVELAGFSQTLVRHGYEFSQGRAIAIVSVLAGALLLLSSRRPRWNMASAILLLIAGVAIVYFASAFEVDHLRGASYSTQEALDLQAKTDPAVLQFCDDFKRHKAAEAKDKNVPIETIEHLSGFYNGAFREYKPTGGYVVCLFSALALILIGVLKLRQMMRSAPAAYAGWRRFAETWSCLLLLVPCLLSVMPVFDFSWENNMAWIPLLKGKTWLGEWVKESRLSLAGVDFWQGRVIAAVCVVAFLLVIATAFLRWKRGVRAAALSLAGFAAIACTIHFLNGPREDATISWQDFQAVAQHGASAAGSAETRRFLVEHPRYIGQIVELEKNLRALTAKLTAPDPAAIPKVTVTKSADGKTTTTTTEVPVPVISEAERHAQAQILTEGGGTVSLYTYSRNGAQLPVVFGLGLLLLGIRDGYRAWRNRREGGTPFTGDTIDIRRVASRQPPDGGHFENSGNKFRGALL
jgi:predicted Ser/Thr protein kinase/lysylphosphatidylglycerol synthetase-like protein (DUF2156 family)